MGCGLMLKKPARMQARGSIVLFPGQFVQGLPESIYKFYELRENIGNGSYGTVMSAVQKITREMRAIKIINKFRLKTLESQKKIINEVEILKRLDHPHIVKVYEFYEDEFNLYVVMELCTGGELLDSIIKNGSMSEADSAIYFKQILSAVNYMHNLHIAHRDLKLENMLLDRRDSKSIKIADFGTATELKPAKKLNMIVGTISYIAPEVLNKNYNEKCDMWSCGVILFILLTGKLPFAGRTKKATLIDIKKGKFARDLVEWDKISANGKELVEKLLDVNIDRRLSSNEAYNHKWMQLGTIPEVNSNLLDNVLNNLKTFRETSKFQRAVIRYIASQLLSQSERMEMAAIFKALDGSGIGKINETELSSCCNRIFGSTLTEADIRSIMQRVDTDRSGFIDYSEFLAAAIDKSKLLSLERLEAAFQAFDKDKNGKISAQELKLMLESSTKLDIEAYSKLIEEVDQNGDKMVDFNEFKDMMEALV